MKIRKIHNFICQITFSKTIKIDKMFFVVHFSGIFIIKLPRLIKIKKRKSINTDK